MADDKTINPKVIEKHVTALHAGFRAWSSLEQGTPPALGDARWTDHLILSTWHMSDTGEAPDNGLEYRVGRSAGGFDHLAFKVRPEAEWTPESLGLQLSSTIVGEHRRVALINGRTCTLGATILVLREGQQITLRLVEIDPDRVVLEHLGKRFDLRLPEQGMTPGSIEVRDTGAR